MQHHACIHAFPPWLFPGSSAVKGDMIRQVFPKCGFLKHIGDWIRSYLVVFIQTKNLLVFIQSTKFFCWCLTIMPWFNAVDKKTPAMPDSDSSDAEILLSMSMVKLAIDSPETCIEGIWIWRARAWKLLMFQKLPDLVCTSSHISIHFDCTLADGFRSYILSTSGIWFLLQSRFGLDPRISRIDWSKQIQGSEKNSWSKPPTCQPTNTRVTWKSPPFMPMGTKCHFQTWDGLFGELSHSANIGRILTFGRAMPQ